MDKTAAKELDFLQKVKAHLEDGKMAITMEMENEDEEQHGWKATIFLTCKPVIYAANVAEDDLADDGASNAEDRQSVSMQKRGLRSIRCLCGNRSRRLRNLMMMRRRCSWKIWDLKNLALKLIKASYSLLGLISYLTAGEPEVRAWTIKKGTKAPQAAGKIHSDFERGFIRAEIVSYDDLMACGTHNAAKKKVW